jgi:hypothetical protein
MERNIQKKKEIEKKVCMEENRFISKNLAIFFILIFNYFHI